MNQKQLQAQLLQKSAFTFKGCLTNPMEGLVLGNGDMAAVVNVMQHEIRFTLSKSDCWDARFDNIHKDHCMTHDQLIEWEQKYGFAWPTPVENDSPAPQWRENPENISVAYATPSFANPTEGPNPKPMGTFIIRHNASYGITLEGKLDISNGLLTVDIDFGEGKLTVRAFISHRSNTLHLRVTKQGKAPKIQCILEKYPDNCKADIPDPIHSQLDERCAWMEQVIPAGFDVKEFRWCVAANYPAITDHGYSRGSYRIWKNNKLDMFRFQSIRTATVLEEEPFDCIVASATSRECTDPSARAKELAGFGKDINFDDAFAAQQEDMDRFWARSGLWMEDEAAASVWYRGIYSASVYIADNGSFPGIVCNIPVQDYSPWHGACVWNMNIQRWTVHAFVTNHLDTIDAYVSKLEESRPTFEYFAKANFGLDGIFPDFLTLPYVPPEHAYVNNKWGRSLSMLGWITQPIWFYYEYTGDLDWLRRRGYPFLRDAAIFYSGFMKKFQKTAGGDLYPSMLIAEGPGWMPQFHGNRNLTDDLVNFELAFRRAISAAELLGIDKELQEDWTNALQALPPIRYTWDGSEGSIAYGYSNELGYTDWDPYYLSPYLHGKWKDKESFPFPSESTALWMIYPFEYLTGDGDSPLEQVAAWRIRNMYDYTHNDNPYNECHPSVPYGALLRVDGRKWYNHTIRTIEEFTTKTGEYWMFSEKVTGLETGFLGRMPETYVHPIQYLTDILLQTQGGIIRLFPALPSGKRASFFGFLARAGFVVSAKTDGVCVSAEIHSRLGGTCRVKLDNLKLVSVPEDAVVRDGILVFETQAGQTVTLALSGEG